MQAVKLAGLQKTPLNGSAASRSSLGILAPRFSLAVHEHAAGRVVSPYRAKLRQIKAADFNHRDRFPTIQQP
jgi:hypothetical protein